MVGGVIVVLILIIGIIAAVICQRSNHRKQNIDVSALYSELMNVPIDCDKASEKVLSMKS